MAAAACLLAMSPLATSAHPLRTKVVHHSTIVAETRAETRARHRQEWREKYEPYYGCTANGCSHWAIPSWSVNCESGGGLVSENIYGNIETYVPGMSKAQQSVAAYRILHTAGYYDGWLRWETGCTGWPGP